MKKFFITVFIITVCLLYVVWQQQEEAIIIYSSMEQFRGEELQRQLNEKFPDLKVQVMYIPTAKSAAKIMVEQEQSDADIVVGLESAYLDKIKDHLADIQEFSKLDFLDDLKPETHDNKYVTWERSAGCFIFQNAVLQELGLPAPKTYEDLLDPMYRGLIAMPDPKTSSTGYYFYKHLVNEWGETKALQYFDQLEKNIKQFTESGSGPIKLLKQGEVAIGLGMTFQAVNEINDGVDLSVYYPPQGSPYSLTGTAMIKNRENQEDICEVFTYIINDFLVYDKTYFAPEKVLKQQENKIENYPKNIPYADMKGIEDIQEKERLLSLWKY